MGAGSARDDVSVFAREHRLRFADPLPGGGSELRWRGPALVGILNVTPDSFSDGGRHAALDDAVAQGLRLHGEGAILVDVGGESTRPGAAPVSEAEELRRVVPVIERLAGAGVLLSIDTRKPAVARRALAAGARVVNDVGGLSDAAMREVCAAAGAPAVVMHMQGEPATMQLEPRYDDVLAEVSEFLEGAAEAALNAGVPDVVLDPGIGFGKTLEHNLTLLKGLDWLTARGRPVMVGASRKGFLGRLTGVSEARERLAATLAVHLDAARHGAALLRVHDVAAHRQALAVAAALEPEASGEAGADGGAPVATRSALRDVAEVRSGG